MNQSNQQTKQEQLVNGVNTSKLFETIGIIKEKPEVAKFNFRTNGKWINGGHNKTTVDEFYGACQTFKRSQPFIFEKDEPPVLLSDNAAPNAVEAILHALASCLAVGFIYNAAAQGIEIESLKFDMEGDLDLRAFLGLSEEVRPGYEGIRLTYQVKSNAPREKIVELCNYVQKTSPVLDIIRNPIPVTISLKG